MPARRKSRRVSRADAFLLAAGVGLRVGVGLDRLVEVFVLLQGDGPVLHVLLGLLRVLAQLGVRGDVRHEHQEVRVQPQMHLQVVQRAERVVERLFAGGTAMIFRTAASAFFSAAATGDGRSSCALPVQREAARQSPRTANSSGFARHDHLAVSADLVTLQPN